MGKTESNRNEKKGSEGSGKTAIAIIIGVIIILLLVIVIIILLKGKGNSGNNDVTLSPAPNPNAREIAESSSGRLITSEEDAATVMDQMRQEVAEGMFKCDMATTWTFTGRGAESKDAYVANHPDNTKPRYFDVYLKDTDELLYSSPVLTVGTTWTDIKLDKELEPGTYKAKVAYKLLKDEESQEEFSAVNFIITLKVTD